MKKILSIDKKPLIGGFNHHAYITGTMLLKKDARPYILSDYIDIISTKDVDDLWCEFITQKRPFSETCDDYDKFNPYEICRIKSPSGLGRFSCFVNSSTLFNMIEKNINEGYYLFGWFNEYYIDYSNAYNRNFFRHNYLIYGFSSDERMLYSIGYDKNGIYQEHMISYDAFYHAVMSITDENELTFFKVKDTYEFEFSIKKVIAGLYNYVNGTNWNLSYYIDDNCIYGIDVLNKLVSNLKAGPLVYSRHDSIFYRNLLDHKNILKQLVDYLIDVRSISMEYAAIAEHVLDNVQKILLLYVKIKFIDDTEKIRRRMISLLEEVINLEKSYIKKLVDDLSTEST